MKHVDLSTESGGAVPHFLVDRLDPFRTAFTTRTWKNALVLVIGALPAPGKRTVPSCLRNTGHAECKTSVPSTRFSIAPGGNRMSWRDNFCNFS